MGNLRSFLRIGLRKPLTFALFAFLLMTALQELLPPTRLEMHWQLRQLRQAVEHNEQQRLTAMLDPKSCAYNQPEVARLTAQLFAERDTVKHLTVIDLTRMAHVDALYTFRATFVLIARASDGHWRVSGQSPIYLTKRGGRIWIDCGNG